MKYHGNYCGPYWSAGVSQASVVSDVLAVDDFDQTCKEHDAHYALGHDLSDADREFYAVNIGKGFKRSVAAVAVKVQQVIRDVTRNKISNNFNKQTITKNSIMPNQKQSKQNKTNTKRVSAVPSRAPTPTMLAAKRQTSTQLSTVPAAYGYTLRMEKPVISRNSKSTTITGADFATQVFLSTTTSTYEPAASVIINPAFFQSSMLGSLARTFEKFRVRKAVLHYIPQVSTSTNGQLIFCSSTDIKQPYIDGSSSTFLSRALSQSNAIATPVWKETMMDIPHSDEWFHVDCMVDLDLSDAIEQEVQVYCIGTTTGIGGILMLHYTFEFSDPLYTYHSSSIPNIYGNGQLGTFADNSGVNATTDALVLTNGGYTYMSYGTIFRLIFIQAKSTLPTGVGTWALLAKIGTEGASTTSAVVLNTDTISMVTGTVLYATYSSSGFHLYAGLDTARTGDLGGALYYQTATTVVGSYYFIISAVNIGHTWRVTTQ